MRQIVSAVYTYDELSETAKENARNQWREGYDFSFPAEYVMDNAKATRGGQP